REFTGKTGDTQVRVLALPGHEWYGQEMVKIACEAIPVYNQWFGPYPYPQFTVVESYFGWNGNECGGLVMIDERIFGLPRLARNFVDGLLTHEICHQWWYNLVGTNGYAETWMDEGLATHFSHKVIDQKLGKNNPLLTWPTGLGWLPNIHLADYQHELEADSGHSWEEFFQNWLYKTAMSDWSVERVEMHTLPEGRSRLSAPDFLAALIGSDQPQHATIFLKQKGECSEPTTL